MGMDLLEDHRAERVDQGVLELPQGATREDDREPGDRRLELQGDSQAIRKHGDILELRACHERPGDRGGRRPDVEEDRLATLREPCGSGADPGLLGGPRDECLLEWHLSCSGRRVDRPPADPPELAFFGQDVEIVPDRDLRNAERGAEAGDRRKLLAPDEIHDMGSPDPGRELGECRVSLTVREAVAFRNLAFRPAVNSIPCAEHTPGVHRKRHPRVDDLVLLLTRFRNLVEVVPRTETTRPGPPRPPAPRAREPHMTLGRAPDQSSTGTAATARSPVPVASTEEPFRPTLRAVDVGVTFSGLRALHGRRPSGCAGRDRRG